MARTSIPVFAVLVSVSALAGCAPGPLAAAPSEASALHAPAPVVPDPRASAPAVPAPPREASIDKSRCSGVRKPSEPDTVTLDPSARAKLNRLRTMGAVAVRYEGEGCDAELHVLPSCIAPSQKYTYSAYAATSRKMARDTSELLRTLPLGAQSLAGWVSGDRAVRADFVLAGQYALAPDAVPRPQDLLGPDCARATHVVAAVYVGAFAMVAGDTALLERRATVLDLGSTAPELQTLAAEGSAEACRASGDGKPSDRCGVPLKIALIPLEGSAPSVLASTCPPGSVRRGDRCVVQEIVTEVDCPAGTKWSVDRCMPRVVETMCAQGQRFDAGRGCVSDKVVKVARSVAPQPAVAEPVRREVGYLSVDTYPWTRVTVDGEYLGNTPLVRAALPPGSHEVTFENTAEQLRQTTTITTRSGETVSKRLAF
jgi:hypothetical protein